MKTFCELKTLAKSQIRGGICILFAMQLIAIGITYLSCFIPFLGDILSSIISACFTLGMTFVYLKIVRGDEISIGDVFYGFQDLWTAIKAQFFINLFLTLWCLLLLIPGIIKAFSYSMTFFILAENKGMSVLEAITLSRKMMDGHKMELFCLSLSFIGWDLLVVITFGLAGIWVFPYYFATVANFYLSVKADYEAKLG